MKKILELVNFPGERQLKDQLVVINKNTILAKSPEGSVAVKISLKEDLFDKAIGLPVKKTLDCINLFEKYTIKLIDNRLTISHGKKEISILLTEPTLVNSIMEESKFNALKENLKDGTKYTIDSDSLRELLTKYFALGESTVKCLFKNNELNLEIGNENTDNIKDKFDIKGVGEVKNIKLGQAFLDVLSVLNGEIKIKVKESMPVLISQKTDKYDLEILIAQIG